MQVEIQMVWQAEPTVFSGVRETYQQGALFCLQMLDGPVHRFPIQNIHRITEYPLPGMVKKG